MLLFLQLLVGGIASGAIYGMIAIGIVLIFKATGVTNFAQGQIVMVCTMFAWTLTAKLDLPMPVVLLVTLVFSALFGFVVERIFVHPFVNSSFLVTAITTLALFLILGWVALQIWGGEAQPFPSLFPDTVIRSGDVAIAVSDVGVIAVGALLSLVLYLFFGRTRLGIAMRGTADNPLAARLVGIDVGRIHSLTWVVSAIVATIGGILVAPSTYVNYAMMLPYLLKAFAAAVIGGVESLPGAMLGGVILGVAENLVGGYVSSQFKDVLPFLLLVIFLLARPNGLFGRPAATRV
jgi:branched-chain amino acid transport system permease protein